MKRTQSASPAGLSWESLHKEFSACFEKEEVHLPIKRKNLNRVFHHLTLCRASGGQLFTDPREGAPGYSGGSSVQEWSFSEDAAHRHVHSRSSETSESSSGVCTDWEVKRMKEKVWISKRWHGYWLTQTKAARRTYLLDAEEPTHRFWLCMDRITLVLSNSTLTLWGSSWWNFSTASVWMKSPLSHSGKK